jgi:hypothetical protein
MNDDAESQACRAPRDSYSRLQGNLDFRALLDKYPDTVLEVIIQHGTKLLGTFKVKVRSLCLAPARPRPQGCVARYHVAAQATR